MCVSFCLSLQVVFLHNIEGQIRQLVRVLALLEACNASLSTIAWTWTFISHLSAFSTTETLQLVNSEVTSLSLGVVSLLLTHSVLSENLLHIFLRFLFPFSDYTVLAFSEADVFVRTNRLKSL